MGPGAEDATEATMGEDVNLSMMPAPLPARGAGGSAGVEEVAEVRQVTYSVLRNFLSRNTPNVLHVLTVPFDSLLRCLVIDIEQPNAALVGSDPTSLLSEALEVRQK